MLKLQNITKSFPGVKALENVSTEFDGGEIHALVGENGAGKSTLIKVITGLYKPDSGIIQYGNMIIDWASTKQAREFGIQAIYQEFVSFKNMSVAENIFVGNEKWEKSKIISHKKMYEEASKMLLRLGVGIDSRIAIKDLSVADQQIVEIAKALTQKVKLLVLDEPTAVLSGKETELLFGRLKMLKRDGVAIIYISHRIEEIFELCDKVTVLKDGKFIDCKKIEELNEDKLISMMIGRKIYEFYPEKVPQITRDEEILKVEKLSFEKILKDISFSLYKGEILAFGGLIGAGRTILAQCIFGAIPFTKGNIFIKGKKFCKITPSKAINLGVGYLTEDRKKYGLALHLDVKANITAPELKQITKFGLISEGKEKKIANDEIKKYNIASTADTKVINLSGGNQQKVMISRWARICRTILVLDEPTRGVDVGAKIEIYNIMRDLANRGIGIIMISSELQEIVGMADRVLVMKEGLITGELIDSEISEEKIISLATVKITSGPKKNK